MRQCFLIILILGLSACASYDARQHAQMLLTAQRDDQTCDQQGFKFPDDHYVSCRMQLQDDRLHQDWLNLQLMRQSQQQPSNIATPYSPREYYRPLDRDHFVCLLTTEADKREYILCEETDEPQRP